MHIIFGILFLMQGSLIPYSASKYWKFHGMEYPYLVSRSNFSTVESKETNQMIP